MNKTATAKAPTADKDNPDSWSVYIILTSDNLLYTGITNDVARRWHAHCHTKQGAKFFRGRKPKTLLYIEASFDRSTASKREIQIKKLSRQQKIALIETQSSTDWHLSLELSQP